MPGFDRTGPMGKGPMTGGGFGRCGSARGGGGFGGRGFGYGAGYGAGAGRGYGRGGGFCRRFRDYGPGFSGPARVGRREQLQDYAQNLEDELALVRRRMQDLAETRSEEDGS